MSQISRFAASPPANLTARLSNSTPARKATNYSPEDDARRWREGAAAPRDGEIRRRRGTDRHVVGLAKMSFGKHEHEARLAYFRIADDDVLEEVLRMYKFVFVRKTCCRLLVWLVGKT